MKVSHCFRLNNISLADTKSFFLSFVQLHGSVISCGLVRLFWWKLLFAYFKNFILCLSSVLGLKRWTFIKLSLKLLHHSDWFLDVLSHESLSWDSTCILCYSFCDDFISRIVFACFLVFLVCQNLNQSFFLLSQNRSAKCWCIAVRVKFILDGLIIGLCHA